MGKLRTQQNRLVSISDIRANSFANKSALVISEFRHYDASTESYFQYLEIMSDACGLERYFRMIPIKEAEEFDPLNLIPADLSVYWNGITDSWADEGSFIIREVNGDRV